MGSQRIVLKIVAGFLFAAQSNLIGEARADEAKLRDGVYIGMQAMPGFGEAGEHWYHEIRLTISGEDVTLDAFPVLFKGGVKYDSVSDGGFWTYKGNVVKRNEKLSFELKLVDFSYVIIPDKNREPKWDVQVNAGGTLKVDGVTYKPVARTKNKAKRD